MSRTKRVFSVEFKQAVVQEVLSGESQVKVARKHALSVNTVGLWIKSFKTGSLGGEGTGDLQLTRLLAENRELKQLLGHKELQIEFLKKAQTYLHEQKSSHSLLASGGAGSVKKKNARS
jgi:transposase-like protein